jgi:hypothetical protein
MSLANRKFKEVDFCPKNWLNDFIIWCKPPSNLVEFLKRDIDWEEDLKKFEGEFERDEIVEA